MSDCTTEPVRRSARMIKALTTVAFYTLLKR